MTDSLANIISFTLGALSIGTFSFLGSGQGLEAATAATISILLALTLYLNGAAPEE